MAARRLLIVMLILLGVSTLAAALAPPRPRQSGQPTQTVPTNPTPAAPGAGRGSYLSRTITATPGKPAVVRAKVGDELALRVRSKQLDQVAIPKLGQVRAASPDTAASFDLFLDQAGTYDVRLLAARRVVARLVVNPAAQPGRAQPRGSARHGQR